ncbi:hypothetical protein K469DRAFT_695851 [Zopfia rhizophila CBS 207.26]|uniref:Helicase ATP-binding domain-containing protein n=1 Tax=Zopfia rhizophila CBS 207.26 TaxID=1314779 RepID=A0A6A6ENQ1_9PEZI|nr:hypothetical protein K469DRAFT_695851 [Zopfia rhizophila CBS 207.26]
MLYITSLHQHFLTGKYSYRSRHLRLQRLIWMKHYAQQRFTPISAGQLPDIVITTYQTLEFEHRNSRHTAGSVFSVHWDRIIVDEAHVIRNSRLSTSKALASLCATCRWAISGTPIQNRLSDFVGLFQFLHLKPYDDPKVFDDDLGSLWRNNSIEEATAKFKKLLGCIMLRRTKATIMLPERRDLVVRVPFSQKELIYYRSVEQPITNSLDIAGETNSTTLIGCYRSPLQQIFKLRIACNLGLAAGNLDMRRQCQEVPSVLEPKRIFQKLSFQVFPRVAQLVTSAFHQSTLLLYPPPFLRYITLVANGCSAPVAHP